MTELSSMDILHGRILISCPDQPGIVAKVSKILFEQGANITESAQHTTNPVAGTFFMRIAFDIGRQEDALSQIETALSPVASEFSMKFQVSMAENRKKMAIFVSKEEHCLLELLWQHQTGAIAADIVMVISNHPDHVDIVRSMGYPFYHIPVDKQNKQIAEQKQLELIQGQVDFIVLARYMQILSPYLVDAYENRIINIHHSFLPAFVGARPYERAYERGVKIIGATAHYVTAELDAGPIIEQDVQRIHHGYSVHDMKAMGRLIERTVLARAVALHVDDRILIHENKTIVFG